MDKIDFHVHINDGDLDVKKGVDEIKDMCERNGYSGVCIQSLIHGTAGISGQDDEKSNERALEMLKHLPGSFAFAGLNHNRDFVEQTKEYMQSGFSGIKLLEGKPNIYKYFGFGIADKQFEKFFEYCEKEQVPVMLHNNDPLVNWDMSKADERAKKMGWVYDETHPTQEQFYGMVDTVLERYPDLRLCIAHMGFYSDKLERADKLLEKYPNLRFDITPAIVIYREMTNAKWFFEKYYNRLIYGTDADHRLIGFAREYNDKKVKIIKTFLEYGDTTQIDDITVHPIALDDEKLSWIYSKSAHDFMRR